MRTDYSGGKSGSKEPTRRLLPQSMVKWGKEKWWDSGCIFKVEPKDLADWIGVECEEESMMTPKH